MALKKRGLLLINLGTPDGPDPASVGKYLREFLMDPYVVDVPWLIRWFLVNVLIVPRRKHASAELYKTIWTERGSPLLVYLEELAKEVEKIAGDSFVVGYGMRYGNPSLESGLKNLIAQGVDEIVAFPLYPQYAESTTRSSREATERAARKLGWTGSLRFVDAFYEHEAFISPAANLVKEAWQKGEPQYLLMSFHGLPETHVKRTDRSGGQHCLKSANCCDQIGDANRDCYRAQCFATARAIAKSVGIAESQYGVSFQSRLGPTAWIRPYTEDVISSMVVDKKVSRVVVACPAFVADCLETLEEIEGRGAELFVEKGGRSFACVPCVNADPEWAKGVVRLAKEACGLTP